MCICLGDICLRQDLFILNWLCRIKIINLSLLLTEEDGRKLTVFFLACLEYYYNWIDKEDEPMNSELEQANGNCSPFAVILTGEHCILIVAFFCFCFCFGCS